MTLSPLQHLVLLFLAENAHAGRPALDKYDNAIDPLIAFAGALRKSCNTKDGNDTRDEAILPADFDQQRLRKVLDEIKTKLRAAGTQTAALIPLLPTKGRCSLDLKPTAIKLVD